MSRFQWSDRLRGRLRDADYGYWLETVRLAPPVLVFGAIALFNEHVPLPAHRAIQTMIMTAPTITAEIAIAIATSVTVV